MGSMAKQVFPPAQRARLKELTLKAYNEMDVVQREALEERFRAMDIDGDGRVTLAEATRFFRALYLDQGMPKLANDIGTLLSNMWSLLDADGSGELDKMEMGSLALLQNAATCCSCRAPILDDHFMTCATCWAKWLGMRTEQRRANWESQSAWCLQCCGAASKQHACSAPRLERIKNEWTQPVERWSLSQRQRKQGISTTCECCGSQHTSSAEGYTMGEKHVYRAPGGGFLCEWCVCWICCNCGRESEDLTTPAVGLWRRKCLCCECTDKAPGDKRFPRYKMQNRAFTQLRRQCPTCQPSLLDGSLEAECAMAEKQLGPQEPLQKAADARWSRREKMRVAQEYVGAVTNVARMAADLKDLCVVM